MPTPGEAAQPPCNSTESSESDSESDHSRSASPDPNVTSITSQTIAPDRSRDSPAYPNSGSRMDERSHIEQRILTEIAHLRTRLAEHVANDNKTEESNNIAQTRPTAARLAQSRRTPWSRVYTEPLETGDTGSVVETREAVGATSGRPVATAAAQDVESPHDSDSSLAQSMLRTSISPSSSPPRYLHYPELGRRKCEKLTTSFLRPGSKFAGSQTSDKQTYEVHVEIKDVDLEESFLCGYLKIQGLTDDHPTLTTYFQGEIIGPKYKFKTGRPSWGSNEKIDLTHWDHFPEWKRLYKLTRSRNLTAADYFSRDHLFMRWKEDFLVPDHRVKSIAGASFEGFYYICFNQCTGSVEGVYFHAKSEKWQQLSLKHVEDHGCMAAMDFR